MDGEREKVARAIATELEIDNRLDIDITVAVEMVGSKFRLVLRRRDNLSAVGLILPRGSVNGRLPS